MFKFFYVLISLVVTLFCLPKALAEDAVGLTLGGPTFIHFTHGLAGAAAVEAGVSLSYNHATHIYGDYLIETHSPLKSSQLSDIGLFFGIGGLIAVTNKDRVHDDAYYGKDSGSVGFGIRFPVGLDWRPARNKNFSFHLQLVPVVAAAPETEIEFIAGLGLKYHF